MPTKYERTSLRATIYSEDDLKEAVERVRNKELTNYAASQIYRIPTSTLNDRVLGKSGLKSKTLGRSQAIPPEMEARLAAGLRTMEKWGWGLSKEEVLDTVAIFVNKNKLETPFKNGRPGDKWFVAFRERHRLSVKKPQAVEILRKKMTDPFVVYEYFSLLKEVLAELHIDDPRRIWNLDETSVALDPSKTKVVGAVGHPSTRTTAGPGKENITVLATVNAAGEKLNPLIVFKGKNVYDEWMLQENKNYDFEIAYAASKRGWMEADIFLNYMKKQVLPGIGTDRPQLMVYDGHVTHVDERVIALAAENGLTILKLPAHTSHLLQPLDLAVFKSFKSVWDRKLVIWQRENTGIKLRKQAFAHLFAEAWQQTSPEVIKNGFKKGGIHPYNPNVVPIEKFDQAAYKRWQKHIDSDPPKSTSKEIGVKSLKLSCLDVINKASSSSSGSLNENPKIAEITKTNESATFEDLLLEKIKQQTNGKTTNKLTRVAKGSEVITRTYLEKQKEANVEINVRSKSAADNEIAGPSGIQNIKKITKTKNEKSAKGVGTKTKTSNKSNEEKTDNYLYNSDKNIRPSALQNININAKNLVSKQNNISYKGKGFGKRTKTIMKSTDKTEKNSYNFEQNIGTSKTQILNIKSSNSLQIQNNGTSTEKGINAGKKTKKSTKTNTSKKMKRSSSVASTFVDSDEFSIYSDSDLENLQSDFFTYEELNMSANVKEKEGSLQREQEIERIVTEIRAEERIIENTKNYTIMEKEIYKTEENEGKENRSLHKHTNIIKQGKTQEINENENSNKKETNRSKKKINIISSDLITPYESAFRKYSTRNLKKIDLNSDLFISNPRKSFAGMQMKGDKQENTIEHSKQANLYDVGDTVLTRYFKKNWNYYVGTINRVDTKEKKYNISFHRAVGKNENVMFVVPKRIDEDNVPEENIVKTIKLLQINENPHKYVLMNEEDSVYF